ncbi:unnamed protein product, partial [Allacma fusca]
MARFLLLVCASLAIAHLTSGEPP